MKPKFGNDANLEINVFSYVFPFKLCICQDPRIARAYTAQNAFFLPTSRLSCSAHEPVPGQVRNGYDRARDV